jgi:hypothetical protein
MTELLTIITLLTLAGFARNIAWIARAGPAYRAWRQRRGQEACARGDHDWKPMPAMEVFRQYHGMELLIEMTVAYYYRYAKCHRCGLQGRAVNTD